MPRARNTWIACLVLCAAASALLAQEGIPSPPTPLPEGEGRLAGIPAGDFSKLRDLIRPQEGESNWRRIDWLTSLHDARLKAAAEGKPILLWSGGGAPPLGGC